MSALVGEGGLVVGADIHRRTGAVDPARRGSARGQQPSILAQDASIRPSAVRSTGSSIDAPCSGLGSARRRPELLWRNRKDELSKLARTQVAMTAALVDLLKPGGRLVYSVCTFPRAETDAAADAIVRHRADLEPVEIDGS